MPRISPSKRVRGSNPSEATNNAASNARNIRNPANNMPSSSASHLSRIRNDGRGSTSRLSSNSPIIMTKAQLRRRNVLLLNSSNTIRTVVPSQVNNGPTVTTKNNFNKITPTTPPATPIASTSTSQQSNVGSTKPSNSNGTPVSIRTTPRQPLQSIAHNSNITTGASAVPSTKTTIIVDNFDAQSRLFDQKSLKRVRHRVSFDLPVEDDNKDSVLKVTTSDKILPKILSLMNWNELLPLRTVCKIWCETIESHPKVKAKLGVITIRPEVESKLAIFNASSVTWTKFRFIGAVVFDMTKPVQNEFFNKHGPLMTHLEIMNRTMSLTALVEVLARCSKLQYFKCNWTPEMYSFNSELIKKYYGIHFNNGTFAHLESLNIDNSSSLTDSALRSILKWCGGSLRSLTLTGPIDEGILTRLKPRWSVDSIKNYFERFGYTGHLQYLDFSWSNLTYEDLRGLSVIDMTLRGLNLNHCKLDDEILRKILLKHGETLEMLKIEGTSFTDVVFHKEIIPRVKVLHIGGLSGTVRNLSFLDDMPNLEELSCHNTQWLEHNMILRPLNSKFRKETIKSLDLGGGIKHNGNKHLDQNLNKTWFSDFTGLIPNIKELNLSQWSLFGTNINFRNICHALPSLIKLTVKDWKQLNDVGITGLYEEEIHQDWKTKTPNRSRIFVGLLKRLEYLDLSGTSITDASVNLALSSLKNLRTLYIDGTRVTDAGLRGLISKVPSLDRISISKCPNIFVTQPRLKRQDGKLLFFGKI